MCKSVTYMLNNAYALKIFFSLPGIVYHTNALSQLERTLDVGIDMRMASHSGARHPSPFAFSHFLFVSPTKNGTWFVGIGNGMAFKRSALLPPTNLMWWLAGGVLLPPSRQNENKE